MLLPVHLPLEQQLGLLMALAQKTLQGTLTFGEVNEKVKVTQVAELETNELHGKENQPKIALIHYSVLF